MNMISQTLNKSIPYLTFPTITKNQKILAVICSLAVALFVAPKLVKYLHNRLYKRVMTSPSPTISPVRENNKMLSQATTQVKDKPHQPPIRSNKELATSSIESQTEKPKTEQYNSWQHKEFYEVYKLRKSPEGNFAQFYLADQNQFRSAINPKIFNIEFEKRESKTCLIIHNNEHQRYNFNEMDIVLTKKHLAFYGRRESTVSATPHLTAKYTPREQLKIFKWKNLLASNLDRIKSKILQIKFTTRQIE